MTPPAKPRLLFLSYMASPHQVRLVDHLAEYLDVEFWFYEQIGVNRPAWWQIPLSKRCRVLPRVRFRRSQRYWAPGLRSQLERFAPDVLMLGGFLVPSNFVAYRWALARKKPVVFFTETFRTANGLRGPSPFFHAMELLYRRAAAVFASNEAAAAQVQTLMPSFARRTFVANYAADIDSYFQHPIRHGGAPCRYLFPNRLIPEYNPIGAIDAFARLLDRHPGSTLRLNAQGPLQGDCERRIAEIGIAENVDFIREITAWDEMPLVYRDADVLLFPALMSNGNFTIAESVASGMGIVVSDRIKGLEQLVKDGENGFVRPPTTEAFVEAAERYIQEPELFRIHADRGRSIVRPLTGAATAKLYARLITNEVLALQRS